MKRIIIFFLLFAYNANAQSKTSLEGKWKVISLQGDDMYLNFKTDSIALFGEFEGIADKTQLDLLTTPIIQSFGECYYIFGSKGQYELIRNSVSIERGTYLIDKSRKTLITTVVRNGKKVTDKMIFKFQNKLLQLTTNDEDELLLTLEKASLK